jgi:putative ABC transport system substrate-binding protein
MRRRDLGGLILSAAFVTSRPDRALSAEKIPRITVVAPIGRFADDDPWNILAKSFLEGLTELGYVNGTNMSCDFFSAEGRTGEVSALAQRVLATSPDVIVAAGGGANEVAHAFKRLTTTVPIVMANSSDPVMQGLVADLARPGGNITGFSGNTGPDFEVKRLELLREAAPSAAPVAYLGLKLDWDSPAGIGVREAAKRLDAVLLHAEHAATEYGRAFDLIATERLRGLFVARNPWNFSNRHAITRFATDNRIAAIYPTREFADVAGLMSYGPSLTDLYHRAAGYVDKILKGAKPADLPVQQPSKFEFVVNTKAAQGIGLMLPPSVLARADEVIE